MADDGPLVSIIIPVYNVEPYLVEALESVRNQTYRNFEAIMVDDGSTDRSGAICDEYAAADTRFRVIHQENGGLSAARNAGMDVMRGDMIAFLDSDDALMPPFIERLVEAMLGAGADLAVCRYTDHRTTGNLIQSRRGQTFPPLAAGTYGRIDALRALVDDTLNLSVWNKLYRRKLWDGLRFPVGHVCEDLDNIVWIFDHCETVAVVDESLYLYRLQRPESITGTRSAQHIEDTLSAQSRFDTFIASHTPEVFDEEQLKRYRESQFNAVVRFYVRLSDEPGVEEHKLRAELRERAVEMANELGTECLTLKRRVAYHMMTACPWIIPATFRVYRHLHMLVLKVTGR